MTNKIIIIEGRDQIGKTTCIRKLVDVAEIHGYNVITMSDQVQSSSMKKLTFLGYKHPFDLNSQMMSNPYAVEFKGCSLEMIAYMLKRLFDVTSSKATMFIFDRLQLSTIVYGLLLRKNEFLRIHQSEDVFIQYMNRFEQYIQYIAEVYLVTMIASNSKFDNAIDDDTQAAINITAQQIDETNWEFVKYHNLSIIENKQLLVVSRTTHMYYDTLEQFTEILPVLIN